MAQVDDDAPRGYTLKQQIACVKRELAIRARFYPGWVKAKHMQQYEADHEQACMRAVLATLEAQMGARE